MAVVLDLDYAAIEEMLNTPDSPVGAVIAELGEKATGIAKAAAPVMKPWNARPTMAEYQYGPVGQTKARTHWSGFLFNGAGQMYTGVNAPYGPTLFLERPARQIHTKQYAFMSEALDAVAL